MRKFKIVLEMDMLLNEEGLDSDTTTEEAVTNGDMIIGAIKASILDEHGNDYVDNDDIKNLTSHILGGLTGES